MLQKNVCTFIILNRCKLAVGNWFTVGFTSSNFVKPSFFSPPSFILLFPVPQNTSFQEQMHSDTIRFFFVARRIIVCISSYILLHFFSCIFLLWTPNMLDFARLCKYLLCICTRSRKHLERGDAEGSRMSRHRRVRRCNRRLITNRDRYLLE